MVEWLVGGSRLLGWEDWAEGEGEETNHRRLSETAEVVGLLADQIEVMEQLDSVLGQAAWAVLGLSKRRGCSLAQDSLVWANYLSEGVDEVNLIDKAVLMREIHYELNAKYLFASAIPGGGGLAAGAAGGGRGGPGMGIPAGRF